MDLTAARSQARCAVRTQSFVDVLGSRSAWPDAAYAEAGAYLASRRRLPLPEGLVSVELATMAANQAGETILSGDEFVLVLAGTIRFQQAAREHRLEADVAAVVARGQPLEWATDGATELLVMRCGAGADGPVRIDVDTPLSRSSPPIAEILIGSAPSCRDHSDFRSVGGEFVCGTWESTPLSSSTDEFPSFRADAAAGRGSDLRRRVRSHREFRRGRRGDVRPGRRGIMGKPDARKENLRDLRARGIAAHTGCRARVPSGVRRHALGSVGQDCLSCRRETQG